MGFLNNIFGDSEPKDTSQNHLNWSDLTEINQLDEIVSESENTPIIIFKHSTRCGISKMVLKNFENEYQLGEEEAKIYFLDILNHRNISDAIAQRFGVWHESPQLLLLKKGKVGYNTSHNDITADVVSAKIKEIA